MSGVPTLTTDEGAALLWLRKAGVVAGCDSDGNIAVGPDRCPLVFTIFDALERIGLVKMRLAGNAACGLIEVVITEAGARHPIEPESERRLDSLMRRFDD